MDCVCRKVTTARVLNTSFRPRHRLTYPRAQPRGYASASPPNPKKPIILEQPDKFRPPSHGSRRNARSSTNTYGAGAYNQNMTAAQLESSKTKSYPHMFPPEGSRMYWILTTRWVHVVFTFVRIDYSKTKHERFWLICVPDRPSHPGHDICHPNLGLDDAVRIPNSAQGHVTEQPAQLYF